MSKVVPAILTEDPQALEVMVRQAESFTDYVQLDVMDGRFVPSRSVTPEHLAALNTRLDWEAHLMVEHPENFFTACQRAGGRKVIFHFEATPSPGEVISRARNLGLEIGLAINPETPLSAFLSLVGQVDSVLFLTVHPGFYGSQFIPEVLDRVKEFRNRQFQVEVGVDGGIKESNIARVAGVGVDVIYVGSAIFLQPSPAEAFQRLSLLAR